jgi:RNA polymerase sigma-70 factor (ECF subfamily)
MIALDAQARHRSAHGEEAVALTALADFEALWNEHASDVHRFALYLSGDPTLADDLTAETFVRAWGARERVDLATVRGYLLAIARNLFRHELRSVRRRDVAGEPDPATPSAEASPEHRAIVRDELAGVLAALASLPEIDRSALLLRAEGGLAYEEIARALDLPLSTVKVKIHRARLRLAAARASGETPDDPAR